MDEAAVAFGANGEMVMSNRAYRRLWGSEGHLGLQACSFSDELAVWREKTAPSPLWHELGTSSAPREETFTMQDGRHFTLDCSTLSTGHRLIRFTPIDAAAQAPVARTG
jgi:hypothetical protein